MNEIVWKSTIIAAIILVVLSCNPHESGKTIVSEASASLHYKQKVEGYDVTVTIDTLDMEPAYPAIWDHCYPAEISFRQNDSKVLRVHVSRFYDAALGRDGLAPGRHYELDFKHPSSYGTNSLLYEFGDCPFFFFDVDFDGEKELMVNDWGGGQYGIPHFAVYDNLSSGVPQLKDYPPFNDIYTDTEFDTQRQVITTHYSAGAGYYSFKEYKRMSSRPILDTLQLSHLAMSEWERNEMREYYLQDSTDFTLVRITECSDDLSGHKDVYVHRFLLDIEQQASLRKEALISTLSQYYSNFEKNPAVSEATKCLEDSAEVYHNKICELLDETALAVYEKERKAFMAWYSFQDSVSWDIVSDKEGLIHEPGFVDR